MSVSQYVDRTGTTWQFMSDEIDVAILMWAQAKAQKESISIDRSGSMAELEYDVTRFKSKRSRYNADKAAAFGRTFTRSGHDARDLLTRILRETYQFDRAKQRTFSRCSREAMDVIETNVSRGETGLAISRFLRDSSITILGTYFTAIAAAGTISAGLFASSTLGLSTAAGVSNYTETRDVGSAVRTGLGQGASMLSNLPVPGGASAVVKGIMWGTNSLRSIAINTVIAASNGQTDEREAFRASAIAHVFSTVSGAAFSATGIDPVREFATPEGIVRLFLLEHAVGQVTGLVSDAYVSATSTETDTHRRRPSDTWLQQLAPNRRDSPVIMATPEVRIHGMVQQRRQARRQQRMESEQARNREFARSARGMIAPL